MIQAPLLLVLIVVAWLTGGGMAVRSVSRIWLRHWAERRLQGGGAATIYLERPQRLLTAAGTGVAVALLIGGMILGSTSDSSEALAIGVVGFALVVIVFGQIVPRALARRWPAFFAPVLLPVLGAVEIVSRPLQAFGRAMVRRGPTPEFANPADADRDAIQDLLREGELEGIGERSEIAIISGVVEFAEKTVAQVMRPRSDIFAVDEDTPPHDLAMRIASAGYSRVPVYRGQADNVIGMIHVFDVLKSFGETRPPIRPVAFATPDDACNELLFRMLRNRLHLAIIRNSNQQLIGMVTLEDLLEELVGDIRDEHDEPAPPRPPRSR